MYFICKICILIYIYTCIYIHIHNISHSTISLNTSNLFSFFLSQPVSIQNIQLHHFLYFHKLKKYIKSIVIFSFMLSKGHFTTEFLTVSSGMEKWAAQMVILESISLPSTHLLHVHCSREAEYSSMKLYYTLIKSTGPDTNVPGSTPASLHISCDLKQVTWFMCAWISSTANWGIVTVLPVVLIFPASTSK